MWALYAAASNTGTTFELRGDNDAALCGIAKAIKINLNSHEGAEWVYLKKFIS